MKILIFVFLAASCAVAQTSTEKTKADEHFHGVQERGEAHQGMGFSQTETAHHFILTSSGGFIQVTANDPTDRRSIEQIQTHFSHISTKFAEGDFAIPHFVHSQNPPGVKTMKKLRQDITYRCEPLDNGAKLVIVTKSQQALAAVHDFLRFQIADHQTGDPLNVTLTK